MHSERKANHAQHNTIKAIAIFVTVALLLNVMAPTLAHAATYLQGTEVNANTLVQDAYVAVTYYDSKGKQKLDKGWIDAVGETSFTIRSGALFGKKTIAYENVLSVIMSDESTESAKQMNEVNRFIRNVKAREIERAKKESKAEDQVIQWLDPINTKAPANNGGANTNGNVAYEVIAGVKKYVGEDARRVIVAKGRYVEVTYRGENGKTETAEGYVRAIDETELTIYQGGLRKRIARERIEVLMVGDHSRQLQEIKRIFARQQQLSESKPSVLPSAVIGEVDQYVGENARKVVVAKGRYVGLTYLRDDGKIEKAEGFVRAMNETELTIQHTSRVGRRIISREKITVLMVCDYPSQLQRAPFFEKKPPGVGTKLLGGLVGGPIGVVMSIFAMMPFLPEDYCIFSISDEDMKCGDYEHLDTVVWSGILVGYISGTIIGLNPYDSLGSTLVGSLVGGGVGIAMTSASETLWPSLFVCPIVGAYIASKILRKSSEPRRFSVGLAPDRDGNLSAVAMLRF